MSLETGALKVGREPEHLRYDPILTNAPPLKKKGEGRAGIQNPQRFA